MTNTEYLHYLLKKLSKKKLLPIDEKFIEYCNFYLKYKDNLPQELFIHLCNINIKYFDLYE